MFLDVTDFANQRHLIPVSKIEDILENDEGDTVIVWNSDDQMRIKESLDWIKEKLDAGPKETG